MRCVKTTQQEPPQAVNTRNKPSFGCQEFLLQFQRGDLEAFEQLYNEKYSHLLNLILWKTGSRLEVWEVEGVVQQVFFHIFKKAPTYRGKTDREAWGWIWMIARNHMIDVIRQKNAYGKYLVELDDETCTSQAVFFDEDGMDQKDWLEKFIPSLSPREQLLLKLLQDGTSHTEIASQLGVCLPRITQIKQSIRKKAQKFEP